MFSSYPSYIGTFLNFFNAIKSTDKLGIVEMFAGWQGLLIHLLRELSHFGIG